MGVCFLSGEVLIHFLCASCITFRHGVGPQMNDERERDLRRETTVEIPNKEDPQYETRSSQDHRSSSATSFLFPDSPDASLLLLESDRLYSMRKQEKHRVTTSWNCLFFCFMLLSFSRSFLCSCYSWMCGKLLKNAPQEKMWQEDKGAGDTDVEDQYENRGGCFRSLLLFFARKSRLPDLHYASPFVLQAIEQYIYTAEHLLTPTQRRCWLLDAPRRFCHVCNRFKAPREHHCHLCRECVAKMDHHCVWIGQCVDVVTGRYFLSLLCWSWISCLVECLLLGYGHYVYRREETQMMRMMMMMEENVMQEPYTSRFSSSSSVSLTTLFGPHAGGLQSSSMKAPFISSLVVLLGVSFFLIAFARNVWTNTTSVEWEVLEGKRRLFSTGSSFRFENPYRIVWPLPSSLEFFSTASLFDTGDDGLPFSSLHSRANRCAVWRAWPDSGVRSAPHSGAAGAAVETRREEGGGEGKEVTPVRASSFLSSSLRSGPMECTAGPVAEEEQRNETTKGTSTCISTLCQMHFGSYLLNILEAYGVLSFLTKTVNTMKERSVSSSSFPIEYEYYSEWSANETSEKNGGHHCSFSFSRRVAIHLAKKVLDSIDYLEQKQRQQKGRVDRRTVLSLIRNNLSLFLVFGHTMLRVWILWAWLLAVPMVLGRDDLFDGLDYPLS